MKAMTYDRYGEPDVLRLEEVAKPSPKDNELLIRVHATSLNLSDYEFLTASHFIVRMMGGLFRPKFSILGSDIAGVVEAVGKQVTGFQPGDAVFGDLFLRMGGLADYVCVTEKNLMKKPDSLTFEQAAALPQAGVLALQGLRDKVKITPGQKVLINGAGGGAGSYAIQIAKLYGAEVTGVDKGSKLELMRAVGADHVMDYTQTDYCRTGQTYDLILDLALYRSPVEIRAALGPGGSYVVVGGSLARIFQTIFIGPLIKLTGGPKMSLLGHEQNTQDMAALLELIAAGKVTPLIDRCYPLSEAAEAFRRLGTGQAQGKLIITMAP